MKKAKPIRVVAPKRSVKPLFRVLTESLKFIYNKFKIPITIFQVLNSFGHLKVNSVFYIINKLNSKNKN